ncbi:MAG: glycoside hydrolase family 19 protein [Patescibacteria group bacterium]
MKSLSLYLTAGPTILAGLLLPVVINKPTGYQVKSSQTPSNAETKSSQVKPESTVPEIKPITPVKSNLSKIPGDTEFVYDVCREKGLSHQQSLFVLAQIMVEHGGKVEAKNENIDPSAYGGYYGRGYIQLTGRNNYTKFETFFGNNLVSDPDIINRDKKLSAMIACNGVNHGTFTGGPIKGKDIDFNNPNQIMAGRAIVNGDGHRIRKGWAINIEQMLLNYYNKLDQITKPN